MRLCRWCGAAELTDPRAIYCSRLCRQSAFRIRRRRRRDDASRVTVPLCFAYADPPYPGKAARFYRDARRPSRRASTARASPALVILAALLSPPTFTVTRCLRPPP